MKALVIFSIAVSILFLLQIVVCILSGLRKGHMKALFGLGANLIAATVAILTARVIAIYGSTSLQHGITRSMVSRFQDAGSIRFLSGDGMTEVIRSVSSTLVALAVFFSLYIILYFLMKIPRNMVYKRYGIHWDKVAGTESADNAKPSRSKASKAGGAMICMLSGIFSAVLFVMPVTATLGAVEDGIQGSQNQYGRKLQNELSPILKSPLHLAASHSGAVALFNFLTGVNYKDHQVILTEECSDIVFIALASSAYTTGKDLSDQESESLLQEISTRLGHSEFMPQLTSDLIDGVSTSFCQKEEFLGVSPLLPGGHFTAVFKDLYAALAKTSADTIRKDIPSILAISSTLYRAATSDGDNSNSLLSLLVTDNTLSDFFSQLYANEDLRNLIPRFVIAGVETVCDKIGLDPGTYKVLDQLSENLSMDAIQKEAVLLSDLVNTFTLIQKQNESISLSTMNTSQCAKLSDIIKDSKKSLFLKDVIPNIIASLLKDSFPKIPADILSGLNSQKDKDAEKALTQFYEARKNTASDPALFKKEIQNIATLYGINPDSVIR